MNYRLLDDWRRVTALFKRHGREMPIRGLAQIYVAENSKGEIVGYSIARTCIHAEIWKGDEAVNEQRLENMISSSLGFTREYYKMDDETTQATRRRSL